MQMDVRLSFKASYPNPQPLTELKAVFFRQGDDLLRNPNLVNCFTITLHSSVKPDAQGMYHVTGPLPSNLWSGDYKLVTFLASASGQKLTATRAIVKHLAVQDQRGEQDARNADQVTLEVGLQGSFDRPVLPTGR